MSNSNEKLEEIHDKSLPRVLLMGDSIRMGYAPYVIENLKGRAEVVQISENCDGTKKILKKMKKWFKKVDARTLDLIHFNSGHHDVKIPNRKKKSYITVDKYRKNLLKIIERIPKYTSAKLIWATTTPKVINWNPLQLDPLYEPYIEASNEIIKEASIPIDDLFSFIMNAGVTKYLSEDGVHFTDEGYKLLGKAVTQVIEDFLGL